MYLVNEVNYKNLLVECFESDSDLIEKWHIDSGKDLMCCVNRTYKDLQKASVSMHRIKQQEMTVGYAGIEGDCFLTGFFIKPEFRTKDNIIEFWKVIDSKFVSNYCAGIYSKNIPAKNFLLKKGEIILEIPELGGLVFLLKKGE